MMITNRDESLLFIIISGFLYRAGNRNDNKTILEYRYRNNDIRISQ